MQREELEKGPKMEVWLTWHMGETARSLLPEPNESETEQKEGG